MQALITNPIQYAKSHIGMNGLLLGLSVRFRPSLCENVTTL